MRDGAETECTGIPLGKGVPAPRPKPPRSPSARHGVKNLADPEPLEQGSGGCRPCFTSVPLGKGYGAWPPAFVRPFSKAHGKPFS